MIQRTESEEKLLSQIRILLVDDDVDIREMLLKVFQKFCKEVFIAEDGKRGLESFLKNKPDIIVTDIGMPNMNGLEMSLQIRQEDKNIPIIVATAFGDQNSMLDSIEIGINQYIKKPLDIDAIVSVVVKMAHTVEDHKMAEEYRQKLETQKLRENTYAVISQIANVLTAPLLVLQDDKVKYVNHAFEQMVGTHLGSIMKNVESLDALLEKRNGFASGLKDLDLDDASVPKNKISIQDHRRKIYQVSKKELQFENENEPSTIYLFEDVTMLEYQRLKSEDYSQRLEEFVINLKYKKRNAVQKNIEIQTHITEQSVKKENLKERRLDETEVALLRKTHIERIHAKDFVANMSSSIYEDIDELNDLIGELYECYEIFCEEPSIELLSNIIKLLEQYAHTIKLIQEFDELAEALFSTCNVLGKIDLLDPSINTKLRIFLESIFQDLQAWKKTIFDEQTAKDIHYLDASLFSSCLQLEMNLMQTNTAQEDDLELF